MEKTFGIRYLEIAGGIWVVACTIVWLLAAVASPTWEDAVAFTFSWAICLGALWWTLDTVRTYRRGEQATTPEAILDERLARGEIDVEEYEKRKSALRD
jgi:uncharacterized membrane protein